MTEAERNVRTAITPFRKLRLEGEEPTIVQNAN